jgi:glycosyltransferase involved in cell wall biosynthesis
VEEMVSVMWKKSLTGFAEPVASILIPVYNRVHMIEECIASALAQTFTDFEVVVIDNCSDDGTWEKCQKISQRDTRVRVLRNEKNIGPVQNWKRCIFNARGKYAKIVFSDDLIEPECLEKMVELFQEDVSLVYSKAKVGVSISSYRVQYEWVGETVDGSLISSELYIAHTLRQFGTLLSPGAALFRTDDLKRNLIEVLPKYDNKAFSYYGAGPDLLLFLLTASQYAFVAHVPSPLVFFREHEDSATTKALSQKHWPIRESYNHARAWFVSDYNRGKYLSVVAARIWTTELLLVRSMSALFSPRAFLESYLEPTRISPLIFLAEIPIILFSAFKYVWGYRLKNNK